VLSTGYSPVTQAQAGMKAAAQNAAKPTGHINVPVTSGHGG
jgi:hypothetical protein